MIQDYIQYGNTRIEYTIIYRKRKSVGISINSEKGVRVSAPQWVSKKSVKEIVLQKAPWITTKLMELQDRAYGRVLASGIGLPYMGHTYTLDMGQTVGTKRSQVYLDGEYLAVTIPSTIATCELQDSVREILVRWYREQASRVFAERVDLYSKIMGVQPAQISVRQQKTRWGSCSSRGNINLNWKLVAMPVTVIDYVVVHELAHLKVMNHSSDFWRVVESVLPDYKNTRKLLKEYGRKLDFLF